eukprot:943505_1
MADECCVATFYGILSVFPVSLLKYFLWKVECVKEGTHSKDERETIMIAIEYVLSHNNGSASMSKIRKRLHDKGFTKVLILNETDYDGIACNFGIRSYHWSIWKTYQNQYRILTDLDMK